MEDKISLRNTLSRTFGSLSKDKTEGLARASLKYFEDKGFRGVGYEILYDAIRNARVYEESDKMQFVISKKPQVELGVLPWQWNAKYSQRVLDSNGEKVQIFPRRIITTYSTPYEESELVLLVKQYMANRFENKVRGFDSSYICRLARKDKNVKNVFNASKERHIKYGLMGTFIERNIDSEGRILHDGNGRKLEYTRKPWIVIPGVSNEETKLLDTFCSRYQVPNKELLDRLLGEID